MYEIYEQPFDNESVGDNIILIDVLRAATVASIILSKNPLSYYMSARDKKIKYLYEKNNTAITIGSPEMRYPNSPKRILDCDFEGKVVLHRSHACGGMLDRFSNRNILICGFSNVDATSQYIKNSNKDWTIICCGFRGEERNDEDKYCADILTKSVQEDQNDIYKKLGKSVSLKIFEDDLPDYPKKDIDLCFKLNSVPFAIIAKNNILYKGE
tara:strand:+ start:8101 stop:8736 length:636 start_codon:yes stop_codon:yes gene_type:complete